ncbi:MAG: DUF177 domain-containing protein [Candidatus Saccharibacteria bacterium]
MRVDVKDILIEDTGFSRDYTFIGETPELDEVTLVDEVEGEVTVTKLEESDLQAEGRFRTRISLECHRCLNTFEKSVEHNFSRTYAKKPIEDQLPIEEKHIDIAYAIRDEILVRLPIKQLCREDCPGVLQAS